MVRVPSEDSAADRARWLAEMSDALDEARRLLTRLENEWVQPDEAAVLRDRVEAAKREVVILRLKTSGGGGGQHFGPEWRNIIPWKRSA